jgi:hypothetical protein
VSNTQIFDNEEGVSIQPPSGQIASVSFNQVELIANTGNGIFLTGAGVTAGTIRNSVIGENGTNGVLAQSGQVFVTVEESSIVANLSNGIQTNSAGANLNVTASTISANGTGIKPTSGSIVSFGNNTLNGNAVDGNFTSTTALR